MEELGKRGLLAFIALFFAIHDVRVNGSTMQINAYITPCTTSEANPIPSGTPIKTIGKYSTAIQDQPMSPKSFNMINVMQA